MAQDGWDLLPGMGGSQGEGFASRNANWGKHRGCGGADGGEQPGFAGHWCTDPNGMEGGRAVVDNTKANAGGVAWLGGGRYGRFDMDVITHLDRRVGAHCWEAGDQLERDQQ